MITKRNVARLGFALILLSIVLNKFLLQFFLIHVLGYWLTLFENFTINIIIFSFEIALFSIGILMVKFPEWIIRKKEILEGALLSTVTFLILLVILESINYFVLTEREMYYVWPPNLNKTLYPNETITPGVHGPTVFTINKLGYRGPLISDKKKEYRILAIGGSTTKCLFLDNSETWPHLLMEALNTTKEGRKVKVMNVGRAGHTTREHILQLEHLTDQYNPDLVIILVGGNDMLLKIRLGSKFYNTKPDYSRAFFYSPKFSIRSTLVYKFFRTLYYRLILKEDVEGKIYITKRLERQNSAKLNRIPFYHDGLEDYTRNIQELINISRRKNVKLLLVTQPFLWKENMTPAEEKMLWLGYDINGNFYSASVLAYLMNVYNARLLEICSKNKDILCFDLASKVPKSLEYFYDDLHLNEKGAELVAQELAAFIKTSLKEFRTS